MRPRIECCRLLKKGFVRFFVGIWFLFSANALSASCLDLADIPLDTQVQSAPGMIMFLIDDSGSMDWSFVTPESGGKFEGRSYLYQNPGDHAYTTGTNSYIQEGSIHAMHWKGRWAGYNRLYYNPDSIYNPWPKWHELPGTAEPTWTDYDLTPSYDMDHITPRSNPIIAAHTLNMDAVYYNFDGVSASEIEDAGGVIVDDQDAGFSSPTTGWVNWQDRPDYFNNNYKNINLNNKATSATWKLNLASDGEYEVMVSISFNSNRTTQAGYTVQHAGGTTGPVTVNQYAASLQQGWVSLGVYNFLSGNDAAIITLNCNSTSTDVYVSVDAVALVPNEAISPITIGRAHYYVKNGNDTFLVNLYGGSIEYYRFNDENNNDRVDAGELMLLEEAPPAGIVTGRTYLEERVNFANWFSFYRKRELTAKNAIANVINTMQGVYIGMSRINESSLWQRALPVKVELEGTPYDETDYLLNKLYSMDSSGGTPLRLGLKRIGTYYQGLYEKPSSTFWTAPDENNPTTTFTNIDSYPYFKPDKGGSCQQAFTIVMTDGYWNGTTSPNVGDADGDGYSNTLADVAMFYYETDLNTYLRNDVPIKYPDLATHQHMVTYGLSFGVSGTIDPLLWPDCLEPSGNCPVWPQPTADSIETIDDLFHASVNGRGQYFNANSPEELAVALEEMKQNIESRLGSAASVATNTIQRQEGSMIYQGIYNTDYWSGDVVAKTIDMATGNIGSQIWSAGSELETTDWNDRIIATYDGTNGIPFRYNDLSEDQKVLLNSNNDLLNYLRGDNSDNMSNGGSFRTRGKKMGDVVHSAPVYHKNVVYIGANDGMLHAFNAADGSELFAYVPNLVFENLAHLSQVGYSHEFYVDGTPYVRNIGTKDVLVCGLNKGGKGYFALDVTNVASTSLTESGLAARVLWEYSATSDNDLGYSYSRPFIVRTQEEGWVVIFGNGYGSVNEEAVFYILNVETGALIKKIHTGVNGCNGLSTPSAIDTNFDGYIDYVYAGDLRGNLWKFDLSGDVASWEVAYTDGSDPKSLFQAKNADGEEQPITVAPDVMKHCDSSLGGYIVVFGTGIYLGNSDFNDERIQSFYGIWDWANASWPSDVNGNEMYLGFLTTDADRKLSNSNLPELPDSGKFTLVQQEIELDTVEWRILTAKDINYYNPENGSGVHVGWYFDLPDSRERSIRDPLIRQRVAIMLSSLPSDSPCSAGGSSVLHQLDACSGGRTYNPQFDADGDGKIDRDDTINIGDVNVGDIFVPPTGKKYNQMLFEPIEFPDRLYINDATGNIHDPVIPEERMGMFYWRVIE